ncbi:MAG: nuclear transport factor 2 family protein [Synechococcales cyanobacterium C42_A2020_086]|nr:nuclear transport factor 2 family protein [Synechococcales cyanobacterium C42_A2020_086]
MKTAITRRRMVTLGSAGVGGWSTAMIAKSSRADVQHHSQNRLAVEQNLSFADYISVINTVNGIAIFADLRDWQRCRQSFTDTVEFDYTSLIGGKPVSITADQQIEQWATFFAETFNATQHLVGSHVVTISGTTATCLSNFQAHHTYLDTSKGIWVLSGYYEHDLVRNGNRWQVNRMKMTWTWEEGTRPF